MDERLQVIVKAYYVQIAVSPEVFGHELKFEGRPNGIRQRVAIPREPEGKRRKDNVNFSIRGGLHHWPVYAQCSFKMTGVFFLLQKQLIRIFAVLGEVIVTNPYKPWLAQPSPQLFMISNAFNPSSYPTTTMACPPKRSVLPTFGYHT